MKQIPTRAHAAIDYAVGAALVGASATDAFEDSSCARRFTGVMGAAALLYSSCTDYELGLFRLIPMPVHLLIDCAWISLLASGPWLFGFARRGKKYWLPHAAVALTASAIVACTEKRPKS